MDTSRLDDGRQQRDRSTRPMTDDLRRVAWAAVAGLGAVFVLIPDDGPPLWAVGLVLFWVGLQGYRESRRRTR